MTSRFGSRLDSSPWTFSGAPAPPNAADIGEPPQTPLSNMLASDFTVLESQNCSNAFFTLNKSVTNMPQQWCIYGQGALSDAKILHCLNKAKFGELILSKIVKSLKLLPPDVRF